MVDLLSLGENKMTATVKITITETDGQFRLEVENPEETKSTSIDRAQARSIVQTVARMMETPEVMAVPLTHTELHVIHMRDLADKMESA